MPSDDLYYPADGSYYAPYDGMYAQCLIEVPNPCRKYHISSDMASAGRIAGAVLPHLVEMEVAHKVVRSRSALARQMQGRQAGKFITLYMTVTDDLRNPVIRSLAERLGAEKRAHGIRPSPTVPKSRRYSHVFIELPLDDNMFIYGGFITDPSA
ncbi:MAG: hypothetical protein PVH00_03055 [Gemmatimonadota bacterium]|jgi:hypothetical protein